MLVMQGKPLFLCRSRVLADPPQAKSRHRPKVLVYTGSTLYNVDEANVPASFQTCRFGVSLAAGQTELLSAVWGVGCG